MTLAINLNLKKLPENNCLNERLKQNCRSSLTEKQIWEARVCIAEAPEGLNTRTQFAFVKVLYSVIVQGVTIRIGIGYRLLYLFKFSVYIGNLRLIFDSFRMAKCIRPNCFCGYSHDITLGPLVGLWTSKLK